MDSTNYKEEKNIQPTKLLLHERVREGDTVMTAVDPVHSTKFSNSLSLNAKEFVPNKILPSFKDDRSRSIAHASSIIMNSQSQILSPSLNTHTLQSVEVDGIMVDSALVAALRDTRERMALFRLENAFVEFLTECQGKLSNTDEEEEGMYDYMDVGGQGFSIILKGNTATTGPIRGPNIASDINPATLRQTSFQRLVLHRLADRFGIIREPSPLSTSNIPLIRLVRVPSSSCIPTKLLIDLDISKLCKGPGMNSVSNMPQDRGQEVDTEETTNWDPNFPSSASMIVASTAVAAASPSAVDESTDTVSRSSNQKVMIMKRSSSSTSSKKHDSDSNLVGLDGYENTPGGSSLRFKGKKVSDKEKAYAEARARIFNLSLTETAGQNPENTTSESDNISNTDKIDSSMLSSESFLFQALDGTASPSGTETPQCLSGDVTPIAAALSGDLETITQQGIDVAVASKVLWRNRKQEECDPDFKRGVIPVVSTATVPSNIYSVPVVPSNQMRVGLVPRLLTTGPIPTSSIVATTSASMHSPSEYYYPVMYPKPLHHASIPVEVQATMRSTTGGGPSSQPFYPQNVNRPQRVHEAVVSSSTPIPMPSSLPYENESGISVPNLDLTEKEEFSNQPQGTRMNPSPVGKEFTINRRSGASPWGTAVNNNKASSNISALDKDFPALG